MLHICLLLSCITFALGQSTTYLPGCDTNRLTTTGIAREGFDITFYKYPWKSYDTAANRGVPDKETYQNFEYLHGGYANYENLGKAERVTNLTFDIKFGEGMGRQIVRGRLPDNYNYNKEFEISNFAMLITGYFRADQTGIYQFSADFVDDYVYGSFGGEYAYGCCRLADSSANPGQFQINAKWVPRGHTGDYATQVNLRKGSYYPVRLFYVNTNNWAGLKFSYTDPSGVSHNVFENVIYQFEDQPQSCPEVEEIGSAVTITTAWTGTFTTTSSTDITTITGSDGAVTTETIYYVATPAGGLTSAVTKACNGTVTTATSTIIITITGSNGIVSTSTICYVATPTSEAVSKITVSGKTNLTSAASASASRSILTSFQTIPIITYEGAAASLNGFYYILYTAFAILTSALVI